MSIDKLLTSKSAFALLALVIIALIIFLFKFNINYYKTTGGNQIHGDNNYGLETNINSSKRAALEEKVSVIEQSADVPITIDLESEIIIDAYQATSASEIMDMTEALEASGHGELADLLKAKIVFCDDVLNGTYKQTLLEPMVVASLDRFCYGYALTQEELYAALTQYSKTINDLALKISDKIMNLTPAEILNEINNIVNDADNPLILEGVKSAILQYTVLNRYFNESSSANQKSNSYINPKIISDAIDIYSCNKFSSCGPKSSIAIGECMTMGSSCKAAMSYVDYLYLTRSQIELDQINNYLRYFHRSE